MSAADRPVVYHIPVCPFCQRLEILLSLKEQSDAVEFQVIDITRARPEWLLQKSRGSTALPILQTREGRILKESLVIMQFLDDLFPGRKVAQQDPYRRAVEGMLTALEGDFTAYGYRFVMNQNAELRQSLHDGMFERYARINDFLLHHAPLGPFLFEEFAWAEAVFTPIFMRFWFLEYYEGFELPDDARFARVRAWRDACLAAPVAQQVSREKIVKLYYDYAKGAGNGALLPGRRRSSFVFEPDWRQRPWPARDKYGHSSSDAELGL